MADHIISCENVKKRYMMGDIAKKLSEEEIKAVAEYISGL